MAMTCQHPSCPEPPRRKSGGYCDAHYWRHRHGKDMDKPINRKAPRSATLKERLYFRLDVRGPDDCWEWQGHRRGDQGRTVDNVHTYGRMGVGGGATQYVHIVSYEVHHGPVPAGMEVRHICGNPPCCNPAHLTLGTRADNIRDSVAAGRHYSYFRDGAV